MPLRAVIGDEHVVAPLLDDGEWARLREALRAGVRRAELQCCGWHAIPG